MPGSHSVASIVCKTMAVLLYGFCADRASYRVGFAVTDKRTLVKKEEVIASETINSKMPKDE